jgi:hypothetical protein
LLIKSDSYFDGINILYDEKIMKIKKKLLLKEAKYYGLDEKHSWNEMADEFINHIIYGKHRGNKCDFLKKINN